MRVFNVAPTGYHAKPLKCLQAGGCAIAPSIPAVLGFGCVCSSCHRNVAPIPTVFWWISWGSRLFSCVLRWIAAAFGGCAIYSCIFGFGLAGVPTGMRRLFLWCFGGFSANPAISAICCWTRNPFWGLRQCIKVACSPFWGCAIYSCLFGVWLALHVLHSVLVDFFLRWLAAHFGGCAIYSCIFRFGLVCRGNGTFIPAVFWWFYCRCFHFCTAPFGGLRHVFPGFGDWFGLQAFTREWSIYSRSLLVQILPFLHFPSSIPNPL